MGELVPLSVAIKQVAEQLGMDESAVAALAKKAKAQGMLGPGALSQGALVAVATASRRALQILAEAEAAGLRADRGRITFDGTDLTPYVKLVSVPEGIPHNPANRRTFYLLGKPYHYLQTDRLEMQPGESPWN